jgi:arylsulfatase
MIDKLGSPDTYNHYPTGWAVAFSTPYRMFKRYSLRGRHCDPLVIHWPKGIKAKGEVRHQYHHCTDIVPTILECCGVTMPDVVDGVKQAPLPACRCATASTRRRADDQADAVLRDVRHARHLAQGLEGGARARPLPSTRATSTRTVAAVPHRGDRSEAHDLAAEHPEKLKELQRSGSRRRRGTTSCR